jgi:hypothetical protein
MPQGQFARSHGGKVFDSRRSVVSAKSAERHSEQELTAAQEISAWQLRKLRVPHERRVDVAGEMGTGQTDHAWTNRRAERVARHPLIIRRILLLN